MAWVVDTCLLIDVAEDDPHFAGHSARLLDAKLGDGLVICPVTYVELSPVFDGKGDLLQEFLAGTGVNWLDPWQWQDTTAAYDAWWRYVRRRRADRVAKRPIADVMIGAFALRHQGLLTRNTSDFQPIFPSLRIVHPAR